MTAIEHDHDYVTQLGENGAPNVYGACMVCHEPPPAICAVCNHPTPMTVPIHEGCLAAERTVLDDIAILVRAWPEPIREILTAVAYDLTGVTSVDDAARLPFGLDAVTDDWHQGVAGIKTTWGALEAVEQWRTFWVDAGAGELDPEATDGAVGYVRSRLVWAATNPDRSDLDSYRSEIRTVRGRLRSLNGDAVETVGAARCLACDGHLARIRAVGVLDDLATCQRCGLAYDVTGIGDALRARIATSPHQTPDALVTEPEARRIFAELGTSTIRQWINRGQLAPAGKRYGAATYRVGDIADLARPRRAAATSVDAVADGGARV